MSQCATIHPYMHVTATGPDVSIRTGHLGMSGKNPAGQTIDVNSRYLTLDGKPVLPVMGEFHFSRYARDEWELELRKMKAGGITIAATYLFWIHHEEERGVFDFSGQRDVRHFVELCGKVGLKVLMRIGPWAHGECRNGGFPDWLQKQSCKPRTNDPAYLEIVRTYWQQVAEQLRGLYFQDGGPIIGIQLENELMENAEHLLTLKEMAKELGLIAPLYTCTGWGAVKIPRDEILPVFGGYPDGFWERTTDGWPGHYRIHYFFSHIRNDSTIGEDLTQSTWDGEMPDLDRYPYMTCEVGGGMHVSYHRRIGIESGDITALALKMIGSGSNLQGYYMYHGGSNPKGKLSTMQESQATGYPNDVPEISYDFQAPLGEFGQVGPAYHGLRILHQFLHDFGATLATMPSILPDEVPSQLSDREHVRWAVRTNGESGFIFFNNYQRREALTDHENVQFNIQLKPCELTVPETPTRLKSGAHGIWPIQMAIHDATLIYATAQPIATMEIDGITHLLFAETDGTPAEFVFATEGLIHLIPQTGQALHESNRVVIQDLVPGTDGWINGTTKTGKKFRVLTLRADQVHRAWVLNYLGKHWIALTDGILLNDPKQVQLLHSADGPKRIGIYPPPQELHMDGAAAKSVSQDGAFAVYEIVTNQQPVRADVKQERATGSAPPVEKGSAGMAAYPGEKGFAHAGVWNITLPENAFAHAHDVRLGVTYVGDCARAYVGGELVTDQFFNGSQWIIGLKQFQRQAVRDGVKLEIVPLRHDAPIYLPEDKRPTFDGQTQIAKLLEVRVLREARTDLAWH